MKRVALIVTLLVAARAGFAGPEPVRAEAPPAAPDDATATPADPAAPAGAGSESKWARPDLPPPVETELLVGTQGRLVSPEVSAPTGATAAAGAAPKRAGLPSSEARTISKPGAASPLAGPRTLLASMKAIALVEGEARVTLATGERVLRPGDHLGADTVRSVAEGVMVLDRAAVAGQPGGPATVIVRFAANGQARVRVLYEQDPTPVPAPRMK